MEKNFGLMVQKIKGNKEKKTYFFLNKALRNLIKNQDLKIFTRRDLIIKKITKHLARDHALKNINQFIKKGPCYCKFQTTGTWYSLASALNMLKKTNMLEITTLPEFIIGYIIKVLFKNKLVLFQENQNDLCSHKLELRE